MRSNGYDLHRIVHDTTGLIPPANTDFEPIRTSAIFHRQGDSGETSFLDVRHETGGKFGRLGLSRHWCAAVAAATATSQNRRTETPFSSPL